MRCSLPPEILMSNGVYSFVRGQEIDLMIVSDGAPPGTSEVLESPDAATTHTLSKARRWFDFYWETAASVGLQQQFSPGDFAILAGSGALVRVQNIHVVNDQTHYSITNNGKSQMVTAEALARPSLDPGDPSTWIKMPSASANEFAINLTVTKLTNPLTDTIYSYLSSKTVFRPYQFRPVLRMVGSPHQRLLIADEVGLGKTIEAGLIWTELEARSSRLDRVLIVCPAMLVPKWRDEMGRRFDRRVTHVTTAVLKEFMAAIDDGEENVPLIGVVSLEMLRSSKLLADLNDLNPHFDLVIVDEAHYLRNKSSRSNELGHLLSSWAEALIFLSATPLNLGTQDLFNLLNLLLPEEFNNPSIFEEQLRPNRYLNSAAAQLLNMRDNPAGLLDALEPVRDSPLGLQLAQRPEYEKLEELLSTANRLSSSQVAEVKRLLLELNTLSSVVTRTRKIDTPSDKAIREPHSISVHWTPAEAELYNAIRAWALKRAASTGGVSGFSTQMPLRQAASCLPAIVDLIRLKDPQAFVSPSDNSRLIEDFNDVELGDEDGNDDAEVDLSAFGQMAEAISGVDTKFDRFVESLQESRKIGIKQVLLFSYFRRTLAYLHRRLDELGYRTRVMDGGVKVADRQRIMSDFRAGHFDILLSSEVGSEGLDFEFCNAIVNYDLPWNPMRVEQRIGRLDRFGQTNEIIFIFNFHVPGTIETDILERLYERIDVFRTSIGELEPILREDFRDVAKIALDPRLTDSQRNEKLQNMEVALAERSHQIGQIEEAREYLAGIESLLIDGFEEDTNSKGRFVGPQELLHLVNQFFAESGSARLHPDPELPDRRILTGDLALGDAVSLLGQQRSGTQFRMPELSALLSDEMPIPVTFSNEDASRNGVELISLRHPIVRAAVKYFEDRPMGLNRFAVVRVRGLPEISHEYLTILYLVQTTGLRPSLELWPLSVNLTTGDLDEEAGFTLLSAVANGEIRDGQERDRGDLEARVVQVTGAALARQKTVEDERTRDNRQLINTRIATQRVGITYKIQRAEETLAKVTADRRGEAVLRLHRGTIRNLTAQLEQLDAAMDEHRQVAVTIEPIAVAVLSGQQELGS